MNLYLIGYRGSGKSTVAPYLAQQLGWQRFDTDEQIEILTGQRIADLFADEGEPAFREWETTVIQAVAQLSEQVVSLGGGATLSSFNRQLIASSGQVVWLRGLPEVLWRRIQADQHTFETRPQLTNLDGLAEVRQVLAQRESVYADCADYTVDTDDLPPAEVADMIANWWCTVDK